LITCSTMPRSSLHEPIFAGTFLRRQLYAIIILVTADTLRRLVSPRSPSIWTRQLILAAALIIVALGYLPLNHYFSDTHNLATAIDRKVPVVPVFAVPYIIFLPLFWLLLLYALLANRLFTLLATAALIVYGCSDLVFATFHTFAPRPHIGPGLLNELVHFVYKHDKPYNDLPSEHASSAVLFALYFYAVGSRRWSIPCAILAGLVVASTIFIKQHTIAGASGGVLLAVVAWGLVLQLRSGLEATIEKDSLHDHREEYSGGKLRDSGTS
jgi:hypothetical protein